MTDRAKIITIYVVVAILSAGVLGASFWLRNMRKERFTPDFDNVGGDRAEDYGSLEKDLTLLNQKGEHVKLSELKGKVWVVNNFFASCPNCQVTASDDLKELYDEFGSNPDFHLVSITINPEVDDLQSYADAMGAKEQNWWFLRGEVSEVYEYLEKEMGFLKVTKNEPPASELFSHDRALLVFDGWKCVKKRDLQFARTQGEVVHKAYFKDVRGSILKSLAARNLKSP